MIIVRRKYDFVELRVFTFFNKLKLTEVVEMFNTK